MLEADEVLQEVVEVLQEEEEALEVHREEHPVVAVEDSLVEAHPGEGGSVGGEEVDE